VAAGYVQAGVEAGIIAGYEDNTFRPSRNLTREEMVVLIMKAYEFGAVENPEFSFIDAMRLEIGPSRLLERLLNWDLL